MRARYRLALTGTPMENRLDELASVVGFIDEQALEPRWRLDAQHATRVDSRREVAGARNLSSLRERLAPWLLRRLRRDVLGQLPCRHDTKVPVGLTRAQAVAHDELDRPIRRLAQQGAKRPLSRPEFVRLMSLLTQQRIICDGMALREFAERWPHLREQRPEPKLLSALDAPKLAAVRELIEEVVVRQRRKVVVFSQWRRMLQLLEWATRDLLAKNGVRAVFFTGQERSQRRTHNLVDFHDDDATRVLFATDAGGVGLNLQRAAATVINVESPWNPAVLEQRIGRVHRNGQARPVDVFLVTTEGGIESRVCELVGNKRALFDGLFRRPRRHPSCRGVS
ncbi:MAG: DEAD/DEAH box helicase [Deltaproteobacteria bacterium]|nr:DEAD/DEAH box helicase [Deltaproteobacteria bacterium]